MAEPPIDQSASPGAPDGPEDQPFWQVPGQPEREKREQPRAKRRRHRRAVRGGTNPSAPDVPDVVEPRDAPAAGETQHDRWLRDQRPPHWE